MTFLQPWMLWGLPLLLIPVIIHLVNRLRHRPQRWAAMRFIISASRSSINQAKLRQFLVLLFRVLAVTALVFFLSRPLVGGWLGWALSPAPEVILLVLDRSASMETQPQGTGPSRREQAITLFSQGLKQYQGASRVVLLDSATRTARELPALEALSEPAFTGPTDTQADLPDLLVKAYQYLVDTKSGAAEVWIASDLQSSNWKPEDARWERVVRQFESLPQRVRFRLLALDTVPRGNTSVTLVDALRRSRGGNAELAVTLDLQRLTPSTDPIILNATLNRASQEYRIDLTEQSLRWRQVIPLSDTAQTGWGSFEIAADANLRDNTAYYVFEPEKPMHALVVTSQPARAVVLQLAAADFSGDQLIPAKTITPARFPQEDLSNVTLLVWEGALPDSAAAAQITHFVQTGGMVIFFPTAASAGQQFSGMGWGQLVNAPEEQPFRIAKWNAIDGPLARTEEGMELPMRQLDVSRRAAIAGTGTPLASFEDGSAFLVRQNLGQGMLYFCATAPDSGWSSLADGYVLVPMIQRLHQDGARRLNAASFLECGSDQLSREARQWEPVDANVSKDPTLSAGVYRAENRLVAVNRPAAEDGIETLSQDRARGLFGNLSLKLLQEQGGANDRLQGEAWRFFVMAMLIFLLVEGLLLIPRKESEEQPTPARPRPAQAEMAETLT